MTSDSALARWDRAVMSTITGTGAVAGSEVIVRTRSNNGDTVLVEGKVRVNSGGHWAAQVQPAPTAPETYIEVEVPKIDGTNDIMKFTLDDEQGGAVADLVRKSDEAVDHVITSAGTAEPTDQVIGATGDVTPAATAPEGSILGDTVDNTDNAEKTEGKKVTDKK